ncbi:MAG: helix-turn-helix transcriptional regulator [Deltaproteobacteria bacterium]|nr:helix-turn-helix transcriptional regulator [Deltaproteobacteria bacterium]
MQSKPSTKPIPAQRFRELRERRGISRRQLAEKAGVDVRTLARFEQGKTIRLRTYEQLIHALWSIKTTTSPRRNRA